MSRALCLAFALTFAAAPRARAFCGFFVGKADADLFNKSSQVALVRDGNRTVLTMSNDYKGPLTEFALVVPVPSVLTRDQIHVGDRKLLERLDAYSSPRLVEYTDPDPCSVIARRSYWAKSAPIALEAVTGGMLERAKAKGVTIEATYTVGEYDILLLSAKQSEGLEAWLRESGYRIPAHASRALAPYIRQDMKFFVAKVNLKEQKAAGFQELRPIQIAYESPRFMLPIRLGMANADGTQDLIVYAITRNGRVESSNYQTVRIPSDADVPEFVQQDFGSFYKSTFARAWESHDRRAILTEYSWNMAWCDPCAAPPLDEGELRELGVFWVDQNPVPPMPGGRMMRGGGMPVMLTRLHVRYDAQHFPEDLMFQETGDQQNFQGRYVLRHAFKGEMNCKAAAEYQTSLRERRLREAETLASLTGWSADTIQTRMGPDSVPAKAEPWWKRIWK
ncbi:MAG TPA: DUF2330 domain-containing protein [Myxococcales bacterium]|jgi:hypothetical protein|nr:DUF2330 domain-containing protein [Myxococcales bacterium]